MNFWKHYMGRAMRETLDNLHTDRFVDRQTDPVTGLTIYKYSRGFTVKAFDKPEMWTPLMLSLRGAVYDKYGFKVNGNMNKFFNHNEPNAASLSNESVVLEKLDGSCVQVFMYEGKPIVTTLGSFQSSQALAAKKWLSDNHGFGWIDKDITYVFEWMDPNNFTTISYKGRAQLVLIGMFFNKVGFEIGLNLAYTFGWRGQIAARIPVPTLAYDELANLIKADEEGYVLVDNLNRDSAGQKHRVKIKGEDFLKLHRSKWGVTPLKVYEWTYGLSPRTVAYDELDEETRAWVDGIKAELASKLAALTEQGRHYAEQALIVGVSPHEYVNKHVPHLHRSFVYASLQGKEELALNNYIREIRPVPDEYPLTGGAEGAIL